MKFPMKGKLLPGNMQEEDPNKKSIPKETPRQMALKKRLLK